MTAESKRDLSEYPRPWFYRPEIYYGFIIFPPVWSVLTLRSPWHSGEGFRGILTGGLAWFFLIAAVVLSVRWVQEGGVVNLFIFVPGILLTLVTQVQWTAHRARYGPPPETEGERETAAAEATETAFDPSAVGADDDADAGESESERRTPPDYTPRRRRRRRRSISRSADSASLC